MLNPPALQAMKIVAEGVQGFQVKGKVIRHLFPLGVTKPCHFPSFEGRLFWY
jgi:hypothetical protein